MPIVMFEPSIKSYVLPGFAGCAFPLVCLIDYTARRSQGVTPPRPWESLSGNIFTLRLKGSKDAKIRNAEAINAFARAFLCVFVPFASLREMPFSEQVSNGLHPFPEPEL